MNDNERILISVLGNSICAGTGCEECREMFHNRECPIDKATREERFDFCAKIIDLLQSGGIKEFSDEDLLNILLNN